MLVSRDPSPMHRLLECDLLAAGGDFAKARDAYETLIRDELGSKNDMDFLALAIGRYRRFLTGHASRRRGAAPVP